MVLVSFCRRSSLALGKTIGLPNLLDKLLTMLRYASLKVNYMTIPVYIVGAVSLVIQVTYSDKLKRRGVFIISCCIPVAVGYLICVGTSKPGAGYAGMFILVLGESSSAHSSLDVD